MECKHCGAEVGEEYRLCPYCRSELEYPKQNVIINNYYTTQQPTSSQTPNRQVSNYQYQQYSQPTAYTQPLQRTAQQYIPPPQPFAPKNNVSSRSWEVMLILCVFLGYFGVHRFYAGKSTSGLIYLFTFGLFRFGWIFDMILILAGYFTDSSSRPIRRT